MKSYVLRHQTLEAGAEKSWRSFRLDASIAPCEERRVRIAVANGMAFVHSTSMRVRSEQEGECQATTSILNYDIHHSTFFGEPHLRCETIGKNWAAKCKQSVSSEIRP